MRGVYLKMLYEVHIVEAVCGKLIKLGYTIDPKLETTQQGFDIIASIEVI